MMGGSFRAACFGCDCTHQTPEIALHKSQASRELPYPLVGGASYWISIGHALRPRECSQDEGFAVAVMARSRLAPLLQVGHAAFAWA